MAAKTVPPSLAHLEESIFLLRGQRVLLDRDLAALYGVTTGNLNKAVQRYRSIPLGFHVPAFA